LVGDENSNDFDIGKILRYVLMKFWLVWRMEWSCGGWGLKQPL